MSVAANQAQVFLRLLRALRPRWHTDHALARTIQSLLTGDRSFGSRDRRLYRELIYTTLRHLPWIEPWLEKEPAEVVRRAAWLAAELPATQAFRAEFATGEAPAGDRAELLPAWFRTECPEIFSGEELAAQLRRAPLWLRLSGAASATLREFDALRWAWHRSELLPNAVRMLDEVDVTRTQAFQRGRIEVQDMGSQMVLETLGIAPGGRWLDACAGAGGKSLQLARMISASGTVEAYDIRPSALAELQERAVRAGARNIRLIARPSTGDYDGVLVDAPCSGSGTWRRSPHLKWTTTPALIAERAELQHTLLAKFAHGVRPGGRLIYATCSLSVRENEQVVARFLAGHEGFEPVPPAHAFGFTPRGDGLTIFPARHDTDGFFVAGFRRR
ncbi:MAG: RsmB/NOP family class I SAM-dependent RNA methyltransferase [Opitutaceae bacterium]|nr:RsmB/NOP family class I SAM-dependent RNA methyltransferase [Opitutaceae bacterium]